MLSALQQMDMLLLKRQGHSLRQIARLTGHSRNTVRAILRAEGVRKAAARQRTSSLTAHEAYLRRRFAETGLSAVRLHQEIAAQGFTGGVHTVRRFVATLRAEGRHSARATVRYETAPGEQAQVDWKHVGTFTDAAGRAITVTAFVMVLSFSRTIFTRFVTSMKLEVLIECHLQAFAFFGGIPASILYDNMKQVRLSAGRWNPQFLDFAGHCGFTPKTHQPYRPRTKGKVERAIRYLDSNFIVGRSFADLADLDAQGLHWCRHTANVRVHATTGRVPQELLAVELPRLAPMSSLRPYKLLSPRTVDAEGLVAYEGSRYSVPPEHVGARVSVLAEGGRIFIRSDECVIAEHAAAARPRSCVITAEHLQAMWKKTVSERTHARHGPPPRCSIAFTGEVQQRDLLAYAEVAG
mgnify:CR=1 FL=1